MTICSVFMPYKALHVSMFEARGFSTGTETYLHHPPLMFTSEIILDQTLLQKVDWIYSRESFKNEVQLLHFLPPPLR